MKTQKKHYNLFKKECQKWMDKLELNKYKIAYEWKDLGTSDAEMNSQESGMTVSFALNTDVGDKGFDYNMIFDDLIKISAKHEVIHLLLSRYTWQAESRYISESELSEAEEELVRKLEKII